MENLSLSENRPTIKQLLSKPGRSRNIFFGTVMFLIAVLLVFFLFLSAPPHFPTETIVRIEKGSSLRSVSLQLKNDGIIRSRSAFEAFVILFGREKNVISTDYYFEQALPVYEVARRVSKGEHHMPKIKVTIPEGFTSAQIADVFSSKLLNFDKD